MAETSEVVIVGGGAAGCSVAYYLALAGVKATVVEREGVGTQASGMSAGGLNPLQGAGIPGPLGPLALESFRIHLDLWDKLKEDTGTDCDGRIVSLIKVAFGEEEIGELKETEELFTPVEGFEARWLDSNEVSDIEPRIGNGVIRGLYAKGNAVVDSYKYTLALAQAAEKLGTKLCTGTVRGLERANRRIKGVTLGEETVSCDQLVLAMGPWARQAEPWLDAYIPVDPLKGELLRLDLPGPPLSHYISGVGGSLYPKPDGLLWAGTTEEWRGFDTKTTDSARKSILQRAVKLIPDIAQARLVLQTACLRPVTPDWLPIIGRAPGWDNVYVVNGGGRKGILLSTGMGKSVSDLMTQSETQLDISPFNPARFVRAGPSH